MDQVHVDDKIRDYIVHLVFSTRTPEKYKLDIKHLIQFGASPRATIYLTVAAKAWALLQGRGYVTPEDIKNIGPDVLRHRIILTYEAEAQAISPATTSSKKNFPAPCRCRDGWLYFRRRAGLPMCLRQSAVYLEQAARQHGFVICPF